MKRRNFARNFQEQLFKVCEINMDISAHEHADIQTEALWFSRDINAAKQRFIFTRDGESMTLSPGTSLLIKSEFPQGDISEHKITLPVLDPSIPMFEWILPDEVVKAGQTEMIQHLYLITETGRVDPGLCRSTINKSILDMFME